VRLLTDGGQRAGAVADQLARFIGTAQRSLDIAVYDFDLGPQVAPVVVKAIEDAASRSVAVRLAYNVDHARPIPVPPPPHTDIGTIEGLQVPCAAIPGVPDLMHHKYVVRDASAVWSGSANWTDDSWEREENVIVVVPSEEIAAAYTQDFEALWRSHDVAATGAPAPSPVELGGVPVRAWFCPAYGRKLSNRIAGAIAGARHRVRIASPVITSGPVLGTLAEVAADGHVSVAGVVDATQIREVYGQWRAKPGTQWKLTSLGQVLRDGDFSGKRSTPYAPGSVHDYMHAKVTVADSVAFVGSFNLSHSGELNAENVLEIADPAIADRLAAFVDEVRARYPKAPLPGHHTGDA
jgi:phosphatidylserine/phosphatidylglycerophosphate/cardiolipin synthase-like enzyme